MSLQLKRGSTLRLHCTHSLGGVEVDLTGYTITATAKGRGDTSFALTVAIDADQVANPGEFTLSAATALWDAGKYSIDVRFAASGNVYYSDTFLLSIVEPVTTS